MQFTTKFFGTPVELADLVPGDLAFADSHNSVMLFLVVGTGERKEYILLRKWPETGGPYPHPINEAVLHQHVYRRVSGKLHLERPGGDDGELGVPLAAFPMHAQNSNLVCHDNGRFALFVTTLRADNYWDLGNGANVAIATGALAYVVTHWKLVWVDGIDDDEVVLCEFNVPIR